MCEFFDILLQTYALEPDVVAEAVRSLLNASNVVADRSALAAGRAMLGEGALEGAHPLILTVCFRIPCSLFTSVFLMWRWTQRRERRMALRWTKFL